MYNDIYSDSGLDHRDANNWRFEDGSKLVWAGWYTENGDKNQPNEAATGEMCSRMHEPFDYKWADLGCDKKFGYICEPLWYSNCE